MEIIEIYTDFIKLERAIKLSGTTLTGGEAKMLIISEAVSVNGEVSTQRGKKLYDGDKIVVRYGDDPEEFIIKKV